jgi:hypothetical protein
MKNCNNEGVIGPVPGFIGCLQALECIKLILYKNNIGNFSPLLSKILFINGIDISLNIYNINKKIDCNVCSNLYKEIINLHSFSNVSYYFVKKNYNNIYLFDIINDYNNFHIIGSISVPLYLFHLFVKFLFKKIAYYTIIVICYDFYFKSSIIYKLLKQYSFFNIYFIKNDYINIKFKKY